MKNDAVSSVVGEMLMIVLVLLLVPMVTITLMNQIPDNRVPTVTITMSNTPTDITLYHKGGDYLLKSDITVIVRGVSETFFDSKSITFSSDRQTFDLGDRMTISAVPKSGDSISLVVKNAVVFSGVVP